ncbi:MAG: glycosyltransferase family 4 protein [Fibrobacteria bacterium]
MKVLILWSGAAVPAYRQFFLELAKNMQVRVLSPRNWTHGSQSFRGESFRAPGCEIIPVAYLPERSPRYWVPSLIFHLLAYRPRYLYVMDEMDRPSLAWHALAARLAWPPVRVVSYALQNLAKPAYHRWYHRAATWINGKLVARAIAASREAETVLRGNGFSKPTRVVPLWASEDFFYPGAPSEINRFRQALGVREGELLLLYAGSMAEAKGLSLLLQVLPRFPRLRVASAGNGPLAESVSGAAEGRWTHLGALAGADLRRFYQAGDYVILPSLTMPDWKEQIGRSLLEGILCGCIALGSDSGHIPELTLFPQATFRQGDAESFATLLAALPLADAPAVREAQSRNVKARFTAAAAAGATWDFLEWEPA